MHAVQATIEEKICRIVELRDLIPELKKEKTALEAAVGEYMEERDLKGLKTEAGPSCSALEPRLWVGFDAQYTDDVFAWLEENESGDIIKREPNVHKSTLSATVAELIQQGVVPHPALKLSYERKISVRRNGYQGANES